MAVHGSVPSCCLFERQPVLIHAAFTWLAVYTVPFVRHKASLETAAQALRASAPAVGAKRFEGCFYSFLFIFVF